MLIPWQCMTLACLGLNGFDSGQLPLHGTHTHFKLIPSQGSEYFDII